MLLFFFCLFLLDVAIKIKEAVANKKTGSCFPSSYSCVHILKQADVFIRVIFLFIFYFFLIKAPANVVL